MIRTKLAKKILTENDQQHLTDTAGIHSLAALKRARKAQLKKKGVCGFEPCEDCKRIAEKLGLE